MGSYCVLRIGKFRLLYAKSYVPGAWSLYFAENDRRIAPFPSISDGARTQEHSYEYAVAPRGVKERLEIAGITADTAAMALMVAVQRRIEALESLMSRVVIDPADLPRGRLSWPQELELLSKLTFESWKEAIAVLDARDYPMCRFREAFTPALFADYPLARLIASYPDDNYLFDEEDEEQLVRGVLEALPEASEVVLDYWDLVDAGYHEPDEPIFAASGAIVLLTEGRTDMRTLDAALRRMYPYLHHLYSFLDFDDVRVEGGASALCRTVRALLAARIRNPMIALFDNDTAGHAAAASLSDLRVPPNLKIMTLPEIPIASAYPTVGPQGEHIMNVNGLAASIEMYLGRASLTAPCGRLARVEWTGLDRRLNRYQGELEGKHEIGERFLARLAQSVSPEDARSEFPEMRILLEHVFAAFR